jgi:hypothetical protein
MCTSSTVVGKGTSAKYELCGSGSGANRWMHIGEAGCGKGVKTRT